MLLGFVVVYEFFVWCCFGWIECGFGMVWCCWDSKFYSFFDVIGCGVCGWWLGVGGFFRFFFVWFCFCYGLVDVMFLCCFWWWAYCCLCLCCDMMIVGCAVCCYWELMILIMKWLYLDWVGCIVNEEIWFWFFGDCGWVLEWCMGFRIYMDKLVCCLHIGCDYDLVYSIILVIFVFIERWVYLLCFCFSVIVWISFECFLLVIFLIIRGRFFILFLWCIVFMVFV